MSTKLKINITKDVLFKTRFCKHPFFTDVISESAGTNCAISYAIRELLPNVFVSSYNITLLDGTEKTLRDLTGEKICELPEIAKSFIAKFDHISAEGRIEMEPISFEIEIEDDKLEKIVDISDIKRILKNCLTLELVN